jgi:hypothetical protein
MTKKEIGVTIATVTPAISRKEVVNMRQVFCLRVKRLYKNKENQSHDK